MAPGTTLPFGYFKPTELDVAMFLKQADAATRNRLFDAFGEVRLSDYLYIETDHARFVVNAKDQAIGRGLFVFGNADFNKFEIAISLLKQYVKDADKIDLLVDVGANIGAICIPAMLQGFVKRAVAIEPQPTNCQLLRANIAINGLFDQIEVVERAASFSDGDLLTLELSSDNWGDHRISRSRSPGLYGEAERAHISVPSIKLDSLSGIQPGARFLLWMDIQGYEGHALRGAERLLAEAPPLVFEFWPYGMLRADSFAALRQSIANYQGFYDLEKPDQPLRPVTELPNLFDELGPDGRFTDLLVI